MAWYEVVVLVIYFLAIFYLFLYSLGQLHLTRKYLKQSGKEEAEHFNLPSLPPVTIQLPVYNEKFVVERLIDSVCSINYPKSLLEIQVLDDSTDDTVEIINKKIKEYEKQGV